MPVKLSIPGRKPAGELGETTPPGKPRNLTDRARNELLMLRNDDSQLGRLHQVLYHYDLRPATKILEDPSSWESDE